VLLLLVMAGRVLVAGAEASARAVVVLLVVYNTPST
jgi:hypothetical protein